MGSGAQIGGPVCCGQLGAVSAAFRICPPTYPVCSGFIQGSQWGTCQPVGFENTKTDTEVNAMRGNQSDDASSLGCSADHGVQLGGKVCCNQAGAVTEQMRICGPRHPVCVGFVQGSAWGTCRAVHSPLVEGDNQTETDTKSTTSPDAKPWLHNNSTEKPWLHKKSAKAAATADDALKPVAI